MKTVVLDSLPLAELCRKKIKNEVGDLLLFLRNRKITLRVAEITEYELRRELLRSERYRSNNRLNKFYLTKRVIPIDRLALIKASEIWAELRNSGMPTAGNVRIDIDTIMVAQSLTLKKDFEEVIFLTSDPEDISIFCHYGIKVWKWQDALSRDKREINYYQSKVK